VCDGALRALGRLGGLRQFTPSTGTASIGRLQLPQVAHHRVTGAPIHNDQVDPPAQPVHGGQRTAGAVQMRHLGPIDTFLGRPETITGRAAHLDEHELRRWAWVDCQYVDLIAADDDVATEEPPAARLQLGRDLVFGQASGLLACGLHPVSVARGAYPRLIRQIPPYALSDTRSASTVGGVTSSSSRSNDVCSPARTRCVVMNERRWWGVMPSAAMPARWSGVA
jgi:hypothetical protein